MSGIFDGAIFDSAIFDTGAESGPTGFLARGSVAEVAVPALPSATVVVPPLPSAEVE